MPWSYQKNRTARRWLLWVISIWVVIVPPPRCEVVAHSRSASLRGNVGRPCRQPGGDDEPPLDTRPSPPACAISTWSALAMSRLHTSSRRWHSSRCPEVVELFASSIGDVEMNDLVQAFARGMKSADASAPQAVNAPWTALSTGHRAAHGARDDHLGPSSVRRSLAGSLTARGPLPRRVAK